jgi:hypothetical protein
LGISGDDILTFVRRASLLFYDDDNLYHRLPRRSSAWTISAMSKAITYFDLPIGIVLFEENHLFLYVPNASLSTHFACLRDGHWFISSPPQYLLASASQMSDTQLLLFGFGKTSRRRHFRPTKPKPTCLPSYGWEDTDEKEIRRRAFLSKKAFHSTVLGMPQFSHALFITDLLASFSTIQKFDLYNISRATYLFLRAQRLQLSDFCETFSFTDWAPTLHSFSFAPEDVPAPGTFVSVDGLDDVMKLYALVKGSPLWRFFSQLTTALLTVGISSFFNTTVNKSTLPVVNQLVLGFARNYDVYELLDEALRLIANTFPFTRKTFFSKYLDAAQVKCEARSLLFRVRCTRNLDALLNSPRTHFETGEAFYDALVSLVTQFAAHLSEKEIIEISILRDETFALLQNGRTRIPPYAVALIGGSAQGKSSCLPRLRALFAAVNEMPIDKYTMFTANAADKFTSGYKDQQMIVVDDVGAVKPEFLQGVELGFILQAINPISTPTLQADASSKGKIFFRNTSLVLTSNDQYLGVTKTMTCPQAVLRRLNIIAELRMKPCAAAGNTSILGDDIFEVTPYRVVINRMEKFYDETFSYEPILGRDADNQPKSCSFGDFESLVYEDATKFKIRQARVFQETNRIVLCPTCHRTFCKCQPDDPPLDIGLFAEFEENKQDPIEPLPDPLLGHEEEKDNPPLPPNPPTLLDLAAATPLPPVQVYPDPPPLEPRGVVYIAPYPPMHSAAGASLPFRFLRLPSFHWYWPATLLFYSFRLVLTCLFNPFTLHLGLLSFMLYWVHEPIMNFYANRFMRPAAVRNTFENGVWYLFVGFAHLCGGYDYVYRRASMWYYLLKLYFIAYWITVDKKKKYLIVGSLLAAAGICLYLKKSKKMFSTAYRVPASVQSRTTTSEVKIQKIKDHTYRIQCVIDDLKYSVSCLALKQRYFLVVRHFAQKLLASEEITLFKHQREGFQQYQKLSSSSIRLVKELPESDLVLIEILSIPHGGDFTPYTRALAEDNLLLLRMPRFDENHQLIDVKRKGKINLDTPEIDTHVKAYLGVSELPIERGHCGSLVLCARNLDVLGVVVAAADADNTCFAFVPIPVFDFDPSPLDLPLPDCRLGKALSLGPVDYQTLKFTPVNATFEIIGRVPVFARPKSSSAARSILHSSVEKILDPVGVPFGVRHKPTPALATSSSKDTIKRVIEVLQESPKPFAHDALVTASTSFFSRIHKVLKCFTPSQLSLPTRILLPEESVSATFNGARIPGFSRMVTDTAAGYPIGGKKSDYVTCINNQVFIQPLIRQELIDSLAKLSRGERVNSISTACVKDEIVKLDKNKGRLFYITDIVNVMLCRMFFAPIISIVSQFPFLTECAQGLNPHSSQWGDMYSYLAEIGTDFSFDGDFSDYDVTMQSDVTESSFEVIFLLLKYCGYSDAELFQVRTFSCEFLAPNVLMGPLLYRWTKGWLSGNLLTFIVNSFNGSILDRVIYSQLTHRDDFDLQVRTIKGGDDSVTAYSGVDPRYNMIDISGVYADHGMRYTSASKTLAAVPYRPLSDTTFFKRGFSVRDGITYAPIDCNSIVKMLTWTCSAYPHEQLTGSVISSLIEAFHYGRDYFDYFSSALYEVCALTPLYNGFDGTYAQSLGRKLFTYEHIASIYQTLVPIKFDLPVDNCKASHSDLLDSTWLR